MRFALVSGLSTIGAAAIVVGFRSWLVVGWRL